MQIKSSIWWNNGCQVNKPINAYVRFVKRNAIVDVFVLQEVRNRTKNIFDFVKHFFVKIHYRRVKWDGFAQTVRPLLQGTKPVL